MLMAAKPIKIALAAKSIKIALAAKHNVDILIGPECLLAESPSSG